MYDSLQVHDLSIQQSIINIKLSALTFLIRPLKQSNLIENKCKAKNNVLTLKSTRNQQRPLTRNDLTIAWDTQQETKHKPLTQIARQK